MVEAQSLASVVELADNPPLRFGENIHPTAGNQLVLYVARVPGSRDLFLTTIKPLEKVVRAEDVQSCLYYIHFDNDKDDEILRVEQERIEQDKNDAVHERVEKKCEIPVIRRKALPPHPTLALGDRPEAPLKTLRHYEPPTSILKPVQDLNEATPPGQNVEATSSRRILGPRKMESNRSFDTTSLQGFPQKENMDNRENAPALPKRPSYYKQQQKEIDEIYTANAKPLATPSQILSHEANSSDTRPSSDAVPVLTLIRRYDGSQINAGKIHADGRIEIMSPGYSRVVKRENAGNTVQAPTRNQPMDQDQNGYECRLHSGGQFEQTQDWSRTASSDASSISHTKRQSIDLRRYSQQIFNESTRSSKQEKTRTADTMQKQTFITPWNGMCEFTTGIANRSLKCKGMTSIGSGPAMMSELRFNLPSSQSVRPSPRPVQGGSAWDSKRSSYFSKRHNHTNASVSEESQRVTTASLPNGHTEDGMDLSLGQEHAGGGFGGKHAKLGKLIIEPKGLQMLDLLVAANMAMWWKVYDKFT